MWTAVQRAAGGAVWVEAATEIWEVPKFDQAGCWLSFLEEFSDVTCIPRAEQLTRKEATAMLPNLRTGPWTWRLSIMRMKEP